MTARTRPRSIQAADLRAGDLLLYRVTEVRRQQFPDDELWIVARAELGGDERLLSWPAVEVIEVERPA